ncbi:transposase, partial [Paenibacillus alvei]|uniref:transposase n=1 Tax=Paenibacillus alvei TaxID=44250 RepID=UPI0013DBECF0
MSKFNLAFKKEAIERYLSGNEGVKGVAKSLGINYELLRMWIKQNEYHGAKAFEKSYTAYSMQYKLDV